MKIQELLENHPKFETLDDMLHYVINRYQFAIDLEKARELVVGDYEDGGIEQVTPQDVVEILDASGIGYTDSEDEEERSRGPVNIFATKRRKESPRSRGERERREHQFGGSIGGDSSNYRSRPPRY